MKPFSAPIAVAFALLLILLSLGVPAARSQEADPWVANNSPLTNDILNDNSIYIEWVGDSVSYYAIELDGSRYEDVGQTTNVIYHTMMDGDHIFKVKAYGTNGGSYVDSVRFTVDRVRPGVIAYGPTGADVTIRANISFSFSEPMDEGSVEIVIQSVSGDVNWDGDAVILDPEEDLEPDIDYQVRVQGKDLAGNDMVAFTWTFRCVEIGTYIGYVVDLGGRPLPHSRVQLEDNSTLLTDQEGVFTIESRWGPQVLRISKDGFSTVELEVFVRADQVVYGEPIQLDQSSSGPGWNVNAVLAVLLLALLLSAFVIFAVIKVGSDEGLFSEE